MGTAINEILFEARGRLKQARVEEFVRQVADEVGKLKEESIDREFLRSEAFSDLIDDVLVRASRTRSAEKKGRLRKVCVDAIQGRYEPDFTDLFLGILDQITDHEMAVLKGFSKLAEARAKGEKLEVGEIAGSQVHGATPDRIFAGPWGHPVSSLMGPPAREA